MPHHCVSCGAKYESDSPELLSGCKCGVKFFRYIKKSGKQNAKQKTFGNHQFNTSVKHKGCITIVSKGKYIINLKQAFQKHPVAYNMDKGKFVIDVEEGLKQAKKSVGTR